MTTKSAETNRRPASPFHAGRQLGSASCAPPSLSAAIAHLAFDQEMHIPSIRLLVALLVLLFVTSLASAGPARIVVAARLQIGKTAGYDPSYRQLAYPNGDVPIEVGVCTDVVVRALRTGLDMDLQKLLHEDMKANFSRYPQNWKLKGPDKNIDHRRVPNLQAYFRRRAWTVSLSNKPQDYRPGDLVTCTVPPSLPHIMIVSDRTNAVGRPFVIHNIGAGTQEEDRLFEFKLTGHYRIKVIEDGAAIGSQPVSAGTVLPSGTAGSGR
jgi:uncharacterized protein